MKNLSAFFNRFHKFLQFSLFFAAFLFSANFVLAENVYYRWTPYVDVDVDSGSGVWDGVWSDTVTVTETAADGTTSTRSEGKFWSFYRNTSGGEWVKTYNKSGGIADFPGSASSKTAFVYFTGEHSVTASLGSSPAYKLEKLLVGDCYQSATSAGDEKITIKLAGSDLKTKELIFGNSSSNGPDVNFEISGGGTLKVSSGMKFIAGSTYNIEIGENTVLDAASVLLDAAAAGAIINFTGAGTLKIAGANFSGCTVNFKLKKLESSGAVNFSGSVENSGTLRFLGNAESTFSAGVENLSGGVISSEGSAVLGFEGKVSNAGEIAFLGSSAATFSGEIENARTLSFLQDSTADFSAQISNSGEISFAENSKATFSDEVKNSGTLNFSGSVESNFSGGFENLSGGVISVSDSAKLDFSGKFVNSASGSARFLGGSSSSVSFGEFSNSGEIYSSGEGLKFNVAAVDSGTWIYSGGTVVSKNISYNILNLSGAVKIDGSASELRVKEISVQAENLEIQGKISAASAKINASKIKFVSDSALSADSIFLQKDFELENTGYSISVGKTGGAIEAESIEENVNFSILDRAAQKGKVEFYSSLGKPENPLKDFSSESALVFNADVYAASVTAAEKVEIHSAKIQTSGEQNYSSEFIVSGAEKTEIISKNGLIHFRGSVKNSGGALLSLEAQNVQFDSDFECDSEAAVLADVYFSGLATDEIKIAAEKIEIGSENSSKNLYISAADGNSSKKVELNSPLEISGSFLLLNGSLNFGKNSSDKSPDIFAEKEIVLMNGNISSMYDDVISAESSWRSGAKNIFEYRGDENFPEKFPDGTPISSENFYSSLEGLGGNTISAGKNFYCNNFALEGGTEWYLKAGDNEKSENFAVAYNSSLKNCVYSSSGTGISYLAAAESVDKGGNNENVCFGHPEISFARTVYDDVIEVSFKDSVSGNPVKIEN